MVNEHERDLFVRFRERQNQSCDIKNSWTFIKRPPAPGANLGKMLTIFLNACSGNGEGGGGGGGNSDRKWSKFARKNGVRESRLKWCVYL